MKHLDRRDNRDIIEKIQRRYILKGTAFVLLTVVILVFFYIYAYNYFADRLGAVNGVFTVLIGVGIPFFALGIHKEISDRSWEGEIVSLKTHMVRTDSANVGVNKRGTVVRGNVMLEYIIFTVRTENDIVTVDRPASELSRFRVGDRLRHIKGTKYLQACRKNSTMRDCVMCGAQVRDYESARGECPQCHMSLVKFASEIDPKTEVHNS